MKWEIVVKSNTYFLFWFIKDFNRYKYRITFFCFQRKLFYTSTFFKPIQACFFNPVKHNLAQYLEPLSKSHIWDNFFAYLFDHLLHTCLYVRPYLEAIFQFWYMYKTYPAYWQWIVFHSGFLYCKYPKWLKCRCFYPQYL